MAPPLSLPEAVTDADAAAGQVLAEASNISSSAVSYAADSLSAVHASISALSAHVHAASRGAADESTAVDAATALTPMGALPSSAVPGRVLFAASTIVSALSKAHKRRSLSLHPTDPLLLNTCLCGLQLFAGLILAPPLLLVLYDQPVRDTLVQLARGLRCYMSGFNSAICVDASDAFGTPQLLTFFILSTAWSAASFGLLTIGGAAPLTAAGVLMLPVTIFAFLRPTPLPYSWAAPPETISAYDTIVAVWLVAALAMYHIATLAGALQGKTFAQTFFPKEMEGGGEANSRQRASDVKPTELQTSLHL
uniref:Uncharacterized protein n=1 Tax=Haptolina brevifila TaxID=156173 RepID=A0A7S2DFC0_9EUKA